MQNEDDLRGLAKVMDFMRALSIILMLIHCYWFCYAALSEQGWTVRLMDKVLLNFNRNTGLFNHLVYTKLFAVVFLALSCLGTKGVLNEKVTWRNIGIVSAVGILLFFFNGWLLNLTDTLSLNAVIYVLVTAAGYLCLLMAGNWMSRLLKNNLMTDVFNNENESFMQETRLMENEYSINLPSRFYYKKKWNQGWINVVNPFRAATVLGTPGSGKSYAVINNYIRQCIQKGYACYVYDFKYDDLSVIAYNTMLKNIDKYPVKPQFYVINFDNPRLNNRCNPIAPELMSDFVELYTTQRSRTPPARDGCSVVRGPPVLRLVNLAKSIS